MVGSINSIKLQQFIHSLFLSTNRAYLNELLGFPKIFDLLLILSFGFYEANKGKYPDFKQKY